MRTVGVCYDTGFINRGNSTHEPFDPDAVLRDMRAIHDDLRCDAVRITGGYVERLKQAAALAADVGLDVWICPFVNGVTQDELLELVADIAEFAERLRIAGANVVLAVGSELSLFVNGFFPGDDFEQRAAALPTPAGQAAMAEIPTRFNEFLGRAAEIARARSTAGSPTAACPSNGSTGNCSTSSPPMPDTVRPHWQTAIQTSCTSTSPRARNSENR
ncbi:hypothetical protein [Nocardia sp. NPDC051570]|uniref:hypothetical protein n=1 Tax=Nocardia sp. NPDC051570 TaxID=3364324 RepID=UPI0037943C07